MLATDNAEGNSGEDFDIAIENALTDKPSGRPQKRPKMSRESRNKKFGFGGGDRRSKQNTRDSTDDFVRGGSSGRGRGGAKGGRGGGRGGKGKPAQRPGKSKRMNSRR